MPLLFQDGAWLAVKAGAHRPAPPVSCSAWHPSLAPLPSGPMASVLPPTELATPLQDVFTQHLLFEASRPFSPLFHKFRLARTSELIPVWARALPITNPRDTSVNLFLLLPGCTHALSLEATGLTCHCPGTCSPLACGRAQAGRLLCFPASQCWPAWGSFLLEHIA